MDRLKTCRMWLVRLVQAGYYIEALVAGREEQSQNSDRRQ